MSKLIYEVPEMCPTCSSIKCNNILHCPTCKGVQDTMARLKLPLVGTHLTKYWGYWEPSKTDPAKGETSQK